MTTAPQRKPDPFPADVADNIPWRAARRALEAVVFYGLLLIVAAAAVPYGEVNSPFQLLFASSIYLLCVVRVIAIPFEVSFPLADKTLTLPIVGLLILTLLQVLPLALPSLLDRGGMTYGNGYVSLDRYASVDFLLIMGSLALMGETLLHLTKTRKRLIAVAATVLVVGIGSVLFGVGRHAIIGVADGLPIEAVDVAPAQYAQFINRNHFALLVEMTLGVLLGILLKARLQTHWKLLFGILTALCWFAIVSANSRGGIMSAGGVIILATFLHFVTRASPRESGDEQQTRTLSRRLIPVFAVAALIAVLSGTLIVSVALIGGETTVSRFERTDSEFAAVDGRANRLEIWQSTVRLIVAFPLIGSGFGAYGRAITPYDTASGASQMVRQAHNEYLEIVAGGGVVAALFTLLFLALVVRRVVQRFKDRRTLEKAIGFGAALGISGVLLHSFVDFGLHVQINSLVFVLLLVLATAPVQGGRRRRLSLDREEIAIEPEFAK